MLRTMFVLCGVLMTIAGCSSGSGSNQAHSDAEPVRAGGHMQVIVTPSAPASVVDPESGISVQTSARLFVSQGTLEGFVKTDWPVKPVSKLAEPLKLVELTSTTPFDQGTVTITFPATSDSRNMLGVTQLDNGTWVPLPTTVQGQKVAVVLSIVDGATRLAHTRIGTDVIRVGLTKVPYQADFTETKVSLIRLAGSGPASQIDPKQSNVILIHGMNNGVEDMQILANKLAAEHQFAGVYALIYPWTSNIEDNAAGLASILNKLDANTKLTIIAHSMGGLVASWAIERLSCGNHVDRLFMLGTPRMGTQIANDKGFYEAQMAQNLNDPHDQPSHWNKLRDLVTASTHEMIPGSPFLTTLNEQLLHRDNEVPYYLVAGTKGTWGYGVGGALCYSYYGGADCDGLVPADSLLSFVYPNVTIGRVTKLKVPVNHSELVTDPAFLNQLTDLLIESKGYRGPSLKATIDNGAIPSDTGWSWSLAITNNLSAHVGITIEKLIMDGFGRDGEWITAEWYDPHAPGKFLPTNEVNCNLPVDAGATFTINSLLYFDYAKSPYDLAPDNQRVRTMVVECHGHTDLGTQFTQELRFVLLDQDSKGPSAPPHRAAIGPKL